MTDDAHKPAYSLGQPVVVFSSSSNEPWYAHTFACVLVYRN